MAKGFKHGAGGGASLNFKVVGGTTEPASPKENTIWVNTDAEIAGWVFSAEEPVKEELYNKGQIKSGCYLAKETAAEVSKDSHEVVAVDIPTRATHITVTAAGTQTTSVSHAFYDADGALISTVLRTIGTVKYEVPDGAKRVRVSLNLSTGDKKSIIATVMPPEGMVWIATDTYSPITFNALKKNGIQVYPIYAKQYVNGAWVDKTAKSYQDGMWVDWIYDLYLYDNGVISDAAGDFVQNSVSYDGGKAGSCTITKNSNTITVGTSSGSGALAYFSKKINLTNFKTLYFNGSVVNRNSGSAGSDKFGIGVWKTIPTNKAKTEASAIMEGFRANGIHELNIENCSGEHYVGIAVHGFGTSTDPYSLATMKQLWLE